MILTLHHKGGYIGNLYWSKFSIITNQYFITNWDLICKSEKLKNSLKNFKTDHMKALKLYNRNYFSKYTAVFADWKYHLIAEAYQLMLQLH